MAHLFVWTDMRSASSATVSCTSMGLSGDSLGTAPRAHTRLREGLVELGWPWIAFF
jgi:hypothetical protein